MRALLYGLWFASMAAVAKPTVLVHGDSLSAAYGFRSEQGWVSLLAKRCDCKVINSSISGETTSGGWSRLPPLLVKHKPDILVLELGANDGLRGLPLNLAETNLAKMIEAGQKRGAQVLLVATAMPPNFGREYNEQFAAIFPRLAKRYHLPQPPFLFNGFGSDMSQFLGDGLHPAAKMQPVILDNIWPALKPLLKS